MADMVLVSISGVPLLRLGHYGACPSSGQAPFIGLLAVFHVLLCKLVQGICFAADPCAHDGCFLRAFPEFDFRKVAAGDIPDMSADRRCRQGCATEDILLNPSSSLTKTPPFSICSLIMLKAAWIFSWAFMIRVLCLLTVNRIIRMPLQKTRAVHPKTNGPLEIISHPCYRNHLHPVRMNLAFRLRSRPHGPLDR